MRKSILVAAALILGASSAHAVQVKCQAALGKTASKYGITVAKLINKCVDGVQKAVDGGAPVTAAHAATCEASIDKYRKARTKTLGKCLGAKCTSADLNAMGHLFSGAPGASTGPANIGMPSLGIAAGTAGDPNGLAWICSQLLKTAEQHAIADVYRINPSAPAAIRDASAADPSQPDLLAYTNGSPAASENPEPSCETHSCVLNATAGVNTATLDVVGVGTLSIDLQGALNVDVCRITPQPALPGPDGLVDEWPISHNLLMLSSGSVSQGIEPVVVLPGTSACAKAIAVEGFCNCGGGADNLPAGVTICADSSDGVPDDCAVAYPGSTVITAENADGSNDGQSTVLLGLPFTNGTNHCVGRLTVGFTVVLAAGTDGIACTDDDLSPPSAPQSIPFTTGSATAALMDGNGANGDIETGIDKTTSVSGTPPGSCTGIDSSNLTGIKFVAAVPIVTTTSPGLPDNTLSLQLTCQ